MRINNKKKNISIIKINSNEKIKSIEFYSKLITKLLKYKVDRSSTIIAIGGGVIGDLCGFVASTVLRGIRFVLIPTTLLSQVDSSIGGKNGINSKYGKNLIGSFYQPDIVLIDPSILKSLSLKQLRSGYAEILKYSLINDAKFYHWLKINYKEILNLNANSLVYAILKSVKIKSKFIQKDEKEKLINSSSRAMLNFGHTFGHALESLNHYDASLTHGEAISIGMSIASKISWKIKNISKNEYDNIIQHLKKVGLPVISKKTYSKNIYTKILLDKKNTNNLINLILLKKIGKAYYKRGFTISKIKKLIN